MEIKSLKIEHPTMKFSELDELCNKERVSRSSHVGNQNLRETIILTNLNANSVLVDTIHGEDNYSSPSYVINGQRTRIASRSKAKNRVPALIPISSLPGINPEIDSLAESSANILEFHVKSIGRLSLANDVKPILLTEQLGASGDIGNALVESSAELDLFTRAVDEEGKIKSTKKDPLAAGVFGIDDVTPKSQGALISLPAMMALDILLNSNNGQTFHMGGRDMISYTRNPEIMGRVEILVQKTRAKLEATQSNESYGVIDVSGLGRAQMSEDLNLSSHYDLMCLHQTKEKRKVIISDAGRSLPTSSAGD